MWQPEVKKHCNESVFYLTLSPLLAPNRSPWMAAYTFTLVLCMVQTFVGFLGQFHLFVYEVTQQHPTDGRKVRTSLSKQYHPEAGAWENHTGYLQNTNLTTIYVYKIIKFWNYKTTADLSSRASLLPLACWYCEFEFYWGNGCRTAVMCCVPSGRGLCVGLITRPEEKDRVCV